MIFILIIMIKINLTFIYLHILFYLILDEKIT